MQQRRVGWQVTAIHLYSIRARLCPAYQFTAIDSVGKSQKGVLEADSARQIRQQLREKSWMPVTVEPVEQKDQQQRQHWWQKGLSAFDLAMFTRQLSVLVAAGIQLEEALRAVAKQSERPHVQSLLLAVRSRVLEGHSLASAMQQAGRFPDLYIATIAAGERSGHLDLIMEQLADYTENPLCHAKENPRRHDLPDYFNDHVICDCDGADDLCGARYCENL